MLTPQEIECKVFKMSFRGYNPSEVDDFLQEICDSYLEIYEDNKRMKEKYNNLSEAVSRYKAMEETLNDSLSVAEKSADNIEDNAVAKAEEIIKNAEMTANSIIAGAQRKIANEAYRYESIKREIEIYKAKIIELLNAQLGVLKDYPKSEDIGEENAVQQMWSGQNEAEEETEPEATVEEKTEEVISEEVSEDTLVIEAPADFDTTEEIGDELGRKIAEADGEVVDTVTDELPYIKVGEDGQYIISKQ